MIKLGDKVRVTAYDLHSGFAEGDVVTCIKVGRGGAHKFQGADGVEWWLEPVDYEPIKEILDLEHDYRTQLAAAYLAGFKASGEGWNGENMITATKDSPEQHKGWCLARETYLNGICGKLSK